MKHSDPQSQKTNEVPPTIPTITWPYGLGGLPGHGTESQETHGEPGGFPKSERWRLGAREVQRLPVRVVKRTETDRDTQRDPSSIWTSLISAACEDSVQGQAKHSKQD